MNIEDMEETINIPLVNPFKLLPENMRFINAGNRLYEIGISPVRSGFIQESNRHKYLRFILGILLAKYLIRFFYSCIIYSTKTNDEINKRLISVYLGEYSYHLPSVRIHFNIMFINFLCFTLFSQLLYDLLSKSEKSFQWLRLFKVLSGKMIPAKIGLKNEEDVIQLIKRFGNLAFIKF
jgi:hypothetical protein